MISLRMLLPLSLFAICGFAQDVRYNFASGEDFAKFKTYKWVQIQGAEKLNQLVEQQVRTTIDAELAKKGLEKTEGDNAGEKQRSPSRDQEKRKHYLKPLVFVTNDEDHNR